MVAELAVGKLAAGAFLIIYQLLSPLAASPAPKPAMPHEQAALENIPVASGLTGAVAEKIRTELSIQKSA